MTEPFKIAIVGLGTVGQGVVDIIQSNADLIAARTGRRVELVAVSSANKAKARSVDISAYQWVDDARELASLPDVDCVIELIGGEDGIAHELTEQALENGKHVVTANKAMVARHGLKLAQKAEYKSVALKYEAAVAGGIPAIKTLKQGLAANNIRSVFGILNGTCNFILSEMGLSGRAFDDVLSEAQAKGYAEADPTFDIDGIDTAHKLCILSALAFGIKPDLDNVLENTRGIRGISSLDLKIADELGYKIKLLGQAHQDEHGNISQSVAPCFVKKSVPLASVDGSFNAVFFDADHADQIVNIGRGAGAGPTASAVVADIMDVMRGDVGTVFAVPASQYKDASYMDDHSDEAQYYIHLAVEDKPGVMANISSAMSVEGLSIDELIQRHYHVDGPVSVVMTTHKSTRNAVNAVLNKLNKMDNITAVTSVFKILKI
ncbi:MAG: homoserine dehydrogenase [Pseudomonadota bacterium]|nr:homoserine dehydrogenase [Pseudomonadota bacterium]MEC9235638.1 homoserine dehydrogenase [Pseudomonadota bacterium]MED5422573.1 homoserine dehydrogenase [Pseudomonadota bacterium]